MAKQSLNTIKTWFKTGFKPTQQQFWDTWDSFWHKDEIIPASKIENLDIRFDEKADADALRSHVKDLSAHGLDQKANLLTTNIFSEDNVFVKNIKVAKAKTNTGIDFNLDLNDKVARPGFAGRLTYGIEDGSLSLSTIPPNRERPGEELLYQGIQLMINNAGDMALSGSLTTNEVLLNTNNNFHQVIKPATAVTDNTELFLPASGGTLARTEDIPVLTAGTNINLTGTYPNITINATGGGSGVPVIPVAYEDLKVLYYTETLVPGQEYLITDFQSTFNYAAHTIVPATEWQPARETLYFGSESYSGEIEPLIVTAVSPTEIHSVARSTVYTEDTIIYTMQNLYSGLWASTKGTILRRTDIRNNNTATFDYRVTQYKTNDGEPQQAITMYNNCTIHAMGEYNQLMPVIVKDMRNSKLTTLNGNIIGRMSNSILDMGYSNIVSHNVMIYNCNIKGGAIYLDLNLPEWSTYLTGICAKVYGNNYSVRNEALIKNLANKEGTSNIISGNDGLLYLQNIDSTGITLTPLIELA